MKLLQILSFLFLSILPAKADVWLHLTMINSEPIIIRVEDGMTMTVTDGTMTVSSDNTTIDLDNILSFRYIVGGAAAIRKTQVSVC